MGDRANIFVIDQTASTCGIYLYTHSSGAEWPEALRLALNEDAARRRWDDPSYLTRILVAHLYADLGLSEGGGGIGTEHYSANHHTIVLDIPNRVVAFAPDGAETDPENWTNPMSFAEFCDQIEATYPNVLRA